MLKRCEKVFYLFTILVLVVAGNANRVLGQSSVGTAFTYQGRLMDNGNLSNGSFDFQFKLFDAATGGTQFGFTLPVNGVVVEEGVFTVELDFGPGVIQGAALWLEIGVRASGDGNAAFSILPRQRLTATPYAIHALNSWNRRGNANTAQGDFLGTTDDKPLEIRVGGSRVFRLELSEESTPNITGGFESNVIDAGVSGSVIGGGGDAEQINRISDNHSVIGGGKGNRAGFEGDGVEVSAGVTVSGGVDNQATSAFSTIGGGNGNSASATSAMIGGGQNNSVLPNGMNGVVAGGAMNEVDGGKLNNCWREQQ